MHTVAHGRRTLRALHARRWALPLLGGTGLPVGAPGAAWARCQRPRGLAAGRKSGFWLPTPRGMFIAPPVEKSTLAKK